MNTPAEERARVKLLQLFFDARDAGDAAQMVATALRLPTSQRFGLHPGQIPALLHEAYVVATTPAQRARTAAALARAWVYGGDADRPPAFAAEAVALADRIGEPSILADALDASLVAS